MLHNKTIAVIVPAFNEEKQIKMVISAMPDFVDKIVVINDCSLDQTASVVQKLIPNFPLFLSGNRQLGHFIKYFHWDFLLASP